MEGAGEVLATIQQCVDRPHTPRGLYDVFRLGFLPVPQLMHCREEFPEAVRWHTKVRNGRVDVYENGKPLRPETRMAQIKEGLLRR